MRCSTAMLGEFKPDVVGWWSMGGLSLTMLETVRTAGDPVRGVRPRRMARLWPLGRRLAGHLHRSTARPARSGRRALDRPPCRGRSRAAARYVFISEFTRQQALDRGLELRDTGVAHSGHPCRLSRPAPPVADWEWKLLYVGRIDRRKGIDTAIEALEHLPPRRRSPSWGAGTRRGETPPGLAAERGLAERVMFSGKLDARPSSRPTERGCRRVPRPLE